MLEIGRRSIKLAGRDRKVLIKGVLADLPQYGVDQESNPSENDQAIIYLQSTKDPEADYDPKRKEYRKGHASPRNALERSQRCMNQSITEIMR